MSFVRRTNWLLAGVYWLLMMGMIGITVYLAEETPIHEAVASGFFFGMMGSIAYAFHRMGEGGGWKWFGVAQWGIAGLALFAFVMDSEYVHPGLGMSALCFLAAGALMFFGYRQKNAHDKAAQIEAQQEWRALGTGVERDWYHMTDEERAEVIARDRPTH
jgi:hypothetical protein